MGGRAPFLIHPLSSRHSIPSAHTSKLNLREGNHVYNVFVFYFLPVGNSGVYGSREEMEGEFLLKLAKVER